MEGYNIVGSWEYMPELDDIYLIISSYLDIPEDDIMEEYYDLAKLYYTEQKIYGKKFKLEKLTKERFSEYCYTL